MRVSSRPPIVPYVRVSYTALHQYRIKCYSDSSSMGRPIQVDLLFYAQVFGGLMRSSLHTFRFVCTSQSAVCDFKHFFICEVAAHYSVQLTKIKIYAPWLFPLFEYYYPHFMSKPLSILIHESVAVFSHH